MALPAFYTEPTLAEFMRSTLKQVAKDLDWTDDESFAEPINDVLLAYGEGVIDLSQCPDIQRLRALARIAAWKAAEEATVGDYDTASAQDDDKRSQVHAQAKAQRREAETALKNLLNGRAGVIASVALAEAEAVRLAQAASGTRSVVSTW